LQNQHESNNSSYTNYGQVYGMQQISDQQQCTKQFILHLVISVPYVGRTTKIWADNNKQLQYNTLGF